MMVLWSKCSITLLCITGFNNLQDTDVNDIGI